MRSRVILGILAGTALWATPPLPVDPGAAIAGNIRVLRGEAYVLRAGQRLPLAVGTPVQVRDMLHTGPDGSLGLILHDDTALSLGPSSELALKEFQYQPNEGLLASVLGLVKGTLVYISGRIAKLAPASVRVETPVGIVAVRGTKLLVKIDE